MATDRALTTRISEETMRRLRLQAVLKDLTIQEIVELALRDFLASLELAEATDA